MSPHEIRSHKWNKLVKKIQRELAKRENGPLASELALQGHGDPRLSEDEYTSA